jgi:enterochelin esterase-like enzyme
MQIGLSHRDLFATIGVFSIGMNRANFESRFGAAMDNPAAARNKLNLFFVGIGKEDEAYGRAKELTEALRDRGVPVRYYETEGGHSNPVWRKLLVEILPLLFQPTPPPARGPRDTLPR